MGFAEADVGMDAQHQGEVFKTRLVPHQIAPEPPPP